MSKPTEPIDDEQLSELGNKLFEDLYSVPYHPTDIDACGLHEKHTPQCYGCRRAKWSNIIKAELRERFDSLTAKQELEALITADRKQLLDRVEKAQPIKRSTEIKGKVGGMGFMPEYETNEKTAEVNAGYNQAIDDGTAALAKLRKELGL